MLSKCSVLVALVILSAGCARETKCAPGQVAAAPSQPQPPVGPVKVVRVALTPPDAMVFVHGERIDHPSGYVELPGPIGYVFSIEVVAKDSRLTRQVTVTADGPEPAQIALLPPTQVGTPAQDPVASDLVVAQLSGAPTGPMIEHRPPVGDTVDLLAAAMGKDDKGPTALSVLCLPACDQIVDNGVNLGKSPIFARATTPGRHVLQLTSASGIKKTLVVNVAPSTTHSLRVSMADAKLGKTLPTTRE